MLAGGRSFPFPETEAFQSDWARVLLLFWSTEVAGEVKVDVEGDDVEGLLAVMASAEDEWVEGDDVVAAGLLILDLDFVALLPSDPNTGILTIQN